MPAVVLCIVQLCMNTRFSSDSIRVMLILHNGEIYQVYLISLTMSA